MTSEPSEQPALVPKNNTDEDRRRLESVLLQYVCLSQRYRFAMEPLDQMITDLRITRDRVYTKINETLGVADVAEIITEYSSSLPNLSLLRVLDGMSAQWAVFPGSTSQWDVYKVFNEVPARPEDNDHRCMMSCTSVFIAMAHLAYTGDVKLLSWVVEHRLLRPLDLHDMFICDLAARYNHWDILQWAQSSGCRWNEAICISAAAGGHCYLLQLLREHGCPYDAVACIEAAYMNGKTDLAVRLEFEYAEARRDTQERAERRRRRGVEKK